jgi:hypothetical protein
MDADKRRESMRVRKNRGLEQDSKGKPIPMAKRLPEDRSRAKKTGAKKKKKSAKR